ncbi:hypothetical protein VTK56DRAFT_2129 [Thermocarpiscus australiensis]
MPIMQAYDEFLRWAQDRGVELHGVEPRPIPGKGIGMVATKPLKANERILYVPASALRTIDTVRSKIRKKLPLGTTVHGILAADLALDKASSKYAAWNAVVPSREDISASLPLAWHDARLHAFLPRPALALLRRQESRFSRDWAAVQQAFGPSSLPITRADYLYAWLLVSTRTFYYHHPETTATATRRATARFVLPRSSDDDRRSMVLQPVADLFNHADADCCEVAFGGGGFAVAADRAYAAGDEVCLCYGRHPSDLLLAEYGFVPRENRWDEACLDDAVLPELSAEQRALLDESGFLGNYVLDARAACYRTQVALRLLCCASVDEWRRLVEEGEDGGEALQREVDGLLVRILRKYQGTVEGTIRELGRVEFGQPCQRDMLRLRWRQIQELVRQAIERLES